MADNRPIGVFDSGLGGLTVVKEICKRLPNENIVYFGDTGRVPYGGRSNAAIRKYAAEDERFLLKHNVKLIVAACGTVSSVAADTAAELPVPFFEVVSHSSAAAAKATSNGIIGVIGTRATVNSRKHEEYLKKINPSFEVVLQGCPMFVPLVEEGWYAEDDIVVSETVRRYLSPIAASGADTLILGCTHYPVLSRAVSNYLGDGVTLINSGTATAEAVSEYLESNSMLSDGNFKAEASFFVTDKADSFRQQASVLLGREIDDNKVKQVDLSKLW